MKRLSMMSGPYILTRSIYRVPGYRCAALIKTFLLDLECFFY